jgi:branched-chain amino acid transport system substrate-binding protein
VIINYKIIIKYMAKNNSIILKIVAGLVVLAVLYFGGNAVFNNNTSETGPIKIGYIGPLTGPSAVLGMDAVKAVEIAVSEANAKGGIDGRQIELLIEDDQYLTKNTVSAYDKLVHTDKVKILLVASYGGMFAVKDRALRDDVLIINPLDCNKDVADADKNILCLATETESIGRVLAGQMLDEGRETAGIMYSTKDTFMALVADSFKKAFEAKGGKVLVESFNYEDDDFRTQILKLKEMEVFVLLGHDEVGLIMKQVGTLGMDKPFFTTGTITSPVAQELAGGNEEDTVFAFWEADAKNQKAKEFNDKFTKLVGRGPILSLTTHPAYDVVKILTDVVLPKTKSTDADKVKAELLKVVNYEGVTGKVTFSKEGLAPIQEKAFRLMGGVPVKI